jgi:hypothetical protein
LGWAVRMVRCAWLGWVSAPSWRVFITAVYQFTGLQIMGK